MHALRSARAHSIVRVRSTWSVLGQSFGLGLVTATTEFYWLQCSIEGLGFSALVALLLADTS